MAADEPADPIQPRALIDFVKDDGLEFTPGTQYRYSNTDNIVAGLIVEAAAQRAYERQLRARILAPLDLERTSLPSAWRMPDPYLHGYDIDPPTPPEDYSEIASMPPSGPRAGSSRPPPTSRASSVATSAAGCSARRSSASSSSSSRASRSPRGRATTRPACRSSATAHAAARSTGTRGTVFGYTQFMAASADGRRSVTVSASTQLSRTGGDRAAFAALRRAFEAAACAALVRR